MGEAAAPGRVAELLLDHDVARIEEADGRELVAEVTAEGYTRELGRGGEVLARGIEHDGVLRGRLAYHLDKRIVVAEPRLEYLVGRGEPLGFHIVDALQIALAIAFYSPLVARIALHQRGAEHIDGCGDEQVLHPPGESEACLAAVFTAGCGRAG